MRTICIVLVAGLLFRPASTSAQAPGSSPAGSFIPDRHWSITVARRLHAAGLTPAGFDPASGTLTAGGIHDALAYAADSARGGALSSLTAQYLARFDAEYAARLSSVAVRAEGSIGAAHETGELRTGSYNTSLFWDPPRELPERTGFAGGARFDAAVPHVALSSAVRVDDDVQVTTGALTVDAFGVAIYGGRVTPGNRVAESGSVVLQGDVPFDGAGMFLTKPVYLPGIARHIGPIGFEGMLARAQAQRGVEHPWFFTARASFQPFSWMGVNGTRGVYAASTDPGHGLGARDLLRIASGQNSFKTNSGTYVDNQVMAMDGWFRSPVQSVPLKFYWEWGADDSSGAWWSVAARVFGLQLAAIPGLPQAGFGVEKIVIQKSNTEHGPWYRHTLIPDGWSEGNVLLGHPLGGHGNEFMVYATADLFDARLRLKANAFTGKRGQFNVFSPTHGGKFHGLGLDAIHSLSDRFDVSARGMMEQGKGWSRGSFELQGSARY